MSKRWTNKASKNTKSIHDFFGTSTTSHGSLKSYNKRVLSDLEAEEKQARELGKRQRVAQEKRQTAKELWRNLRDQRREPEAGPSNKLPRIEEHPGPEGAEEMPEANNNEPMEADEAPPTAMDIGAGGGSGQGPQTASGQSGMTGGGGGMRGAAELPCGVFQTPTIHTRKYKKQYHFKLSWEKIVYVKSPTGSSYMKFPIQEFPWEHLGFYLTDEEIHELIQTYAKVKVNKVKVKVSNETAILNFDVGSSVATVGNNNVGFKAAEMRNLRGHRFGAYEKVQGTVIENKIWGRHAQYLPDATDETSDKVAELGASFVPVNIDNKFLYGFQSVPNQPFRDVENNTSNMYNPSAFNWLAYMKHRRNVSMLEGNWFEQEYTPINGYISGYNTIGPMNQNQVLSVIDAVGTSFHNDSATNLVNRFTIAPGSAGTGSPNAYQAYNPAGVSLLGPSADNLNTNSARLRRLNLGATDVKNENRTINTVPFMPFIDASQYKHLMIDGNVVSHADLRQFKTPKQPTLAIGLLPLVSNDAENTTIKGWMQITMDVECDIEIHSGQVAPFYPHGNSGSYARQFPMPYAFKPHVIPGSFEVTTAAPLDTITYIRTQDESATKYERAYRYAPQYRYDSQQIQELMLANNTSGQLPIPRPGVLTRSALKRRQAEQDTIEKRKKAEPVKQIVAPIHVEDDNSDSDYDSPAESSAPSPNIDVPKRIADMIKKNAKM